MNNKYCDDEYGIVICIKCKEKYYTSKYEFEKYPDQFDMCNCKIPNLKFIPESKVKDPEYFLEKNSRNMESENYHSMTGLAEDIYTELVKQLKPDDKQKLKIAKILCNSVHG